IRCCATSPACCGSRIRSTAVIPRCCRRGSRHWRRPTTRGTRSPRNSLLYWTSAWGRPTTRRPRCGVSRRMRRRPMACAAGPAAGGNPAHFMGHLAAGQHLTEAWQVPIGEGGGYRRKILAQPVAADGMVYVMDSDALVSAFDIASGRRAWRFDTRREDDDSTNVGGGLALDQSGTLYAVNGLADVVALDAAKGSVRWRTGIGAPTRSAPTVVEGRIFV